MKSHALASKNPDILASAKALRRAARRALALGLSTGTPVYAMKAGKIVDLTQDAPAKARRAAPLAVHESRVAYGMRHRASKGRG